MNGLDTANNAPLPRGLDNGSRRAAPNGEAQFVIPEELHFLAREVQFVTPNEAHFSSQFTGPAFRRP